MTIGLTSGTYDVFTRGHSDIIKKAVNLVDKLYVVIAYNPDKKQPYFTHQERLATVRAALKEELSTEQYDKIIVIVTGNEMTVDVCDKAGATVIFRGIRNGTDFEYEMGMEQFNADFAPHITTVFLMAAPDKTKLSSSAIRGLVGLPNWEKRVRRYVHRLTFELLQARSTRTVAV